jgi:RAB protein geranylgeranyltransferase component A
MSNFITNNQTKNLDQKLFGLITKSYEMKFMSIPLKNYKVIENFIRKII